MPIPSYNEVFERTLAMAREVGEAETERNSPNTSGLLAKGVSDFVSKLLFTPSGERKTYVAGLTGDTSGAEGATPGYVSLDRPIQTGQTLMERFAGKLTGQKPSVLPPGTIPLTQEDAAKYQQEAFMQKMKGDQALGVEAKKQEGRIATLKERAKLFVKASGGSGQAKLATEKMSLEESEYFREKLGLGTDPLGSNLLTYGFVDRALREQGLDSAAEFRGLGLLVAATKDPLGRTPKDVQETVRAAQGSREGKGSFGTKNFATEAEALASAWPGGTEVTIGGRPAKLPKR